MASFSRGKHGKEDKGTESERQTRGHFRGGTSGTIITDIPDRTGKAYRTPRTEGPLTTWT